MLLCALAHHTDPSCSGALRRCAARLTRAEALDWCGVTARCVGPARRAHAPARPHARGLRGGVAPGTHASSQTRTTNDEHCAPLVGSVRGGALDARLAARKLQPHAEQGA
jgi:hypothetical protein